MALLDTGAWQGKVWTGAWTDGSGGTYDAVEPATGETIGSVGKATPADVSTAAARAVEAQRGWAALPYEERAAVLRKAGDVPLGQRRRDQGLAGPRVRGDPAVRRLPGAHQRAGVLRGLRACRATRTASCCAAARPACSFARRVPVGVVGVIAPFNVPTILAIRAVAPALALGNAVILKPDPRTAVSGGAMFARDLRGGRPAGRCAAGAARRRRRRRGARGRARRPDHRLHRLDPRRPRGRRAGRSAPQAGPPGARRQLGADRAATTSTSTAAASVGAWGSFAHQGQICMTTGRHLVHESIADEYTQILAEKAEKLPVGDPFRDHGRARPAHRRRPARPRARPGHRQRRRRRAGRAPAARSRGCSTGRPCSANVPVDTPAYQEEIFGPVAPVTPFSTIDEVVEARRRHRVRPVARHPHPRRLRGPRAGRAHPVRPGAHQRPDGQRRGRGPVRRRRRVRAPARGTAARRPTSRRSPRRSGSRCAGDLPAYPF